MPGAAARLGHLVVLVGAVLLVTPTTTSAAGESERATPTASTTIGWHLCPASEFGDEVAASMQCAVISVPVDYDRPRGHTMSIRISRRPATRQPSLGPLFVNPGGPGASAVAMASTFAVKPTLYTQRGLERFEQFEQFDVIGVDPRGVGGSTRLACPEGGSLPQIVVSARGAPPTRSERAFKTFAEECGKDPNVRFFGTNNVARDMDRVRELLGAERMTYLGTSYGTELGTAYLSLFPDRVRAAVLDAAADPSEDYVSFAIARVRAQQRAFDRYLTHCEQDGCAWTDGRDPATAWKKLQSDLDDDPVTLPDGTKRNGDDLEAYALQVHGREFSDVDDQLDAFVGGGDPAELFSSPDDDPAPFLASNCLDYPIADYHDAFAEIERELGRRVAHTEAPLLALCNAWARTDDRVTVRRVPTGIPVVVLATRGDSQTPYVSGVRLARGLDAPLLTWDANVHGGFGASACVSGKEFALLVDLTPITDEASCSDAAITDPIAPPVDPQLN
jgi:pimeloyl-ACP methyl ester carboxylesterase